MTQEELDNKLITAAKHGNTETIIGIIDSGADVNAYSPNGYTAITSAASFGHTDCVRQLLKGGADIDQPDGEGETALMKAVLRGRLGTVVLLLKNRADLNKTDMRGSTALLLACSDRQENSVIVRELIEAGADVNIPDSKGITPLMNLLRFNGTEALIKILIEHGADINAVNSSGETPLIYACRYRMASTVKRMLYRGADVHARDIEGRTPLLEACKNIYVNEDTVKALLNAGADSNDTDPGGMTPTMCLALNRGNIELMTLLVNAGADIYAVNKEGQSAQDILEERHPDKYSEWIEETVVKPQRERLKNEDSAKGSITGYEFDI